LEGWAISNIQLALESVPASSKKPCLVLEQASTNSCAYNRSTGVPTISQTQRCETGARAVWTDQHEDLAHRPCHIATARSDRVAPPRGGVAAAMNHINDQCNYVHPQRALEDVTAQGRPSQPTPPTRAQHVLVRRGPDRALFSLGARWYACVVPCTNESRWYACMVPCTNESR
jgi:hypothetical protein